MSRGRVTVKGTGGSQDCSSHPHTPQPHPTATSDPPAPLLPLLRPPGHFAGPLPHRAPRARGGSAQATERAAHGGLRLAAALAVPAGAAELLTPRPRSSAGPAHPAPRDPARPRLSFSRSRRPQSLGPCCCARTASARPPRSCGGCSSRRRGKRRRGPRRCVPPPSSPHAPTFTPARTPSLHTLTHTLTYTLTHTLTHTLSSHHPLHPHSHPPPHPPPQHPPHPP